MFSSFSGDGVLNGGNAYLRSCSRETVCVSILRVVLSHSKRHDHSHPLWINSPRFSYHIYRKGLQYTSFLKI